MPGSINHKGVTFAKPNQVLGNISMATFRHCVFRAWARTAFHKSLLRTFCISFTTPPGKRGAGGQRTMRPVRQARLGGKFLAFRRRRCGGGKPAGGGGGGRGNIKWREKPNSYFF